MSFDSSQRPVATASSSHRIVPSDVRGRAAMMAMGLLSVLILLYFAADAVVAPLRVPFDPREGWNAYNAIAAMSKGPLYPSDDVFWFNNYPPLSFYLVGGLGRLLGDEIVAGRILSLISTAGAAAAIGWTARKLRCGPFETALAVILFLASPWVLSKFAVIDDPQMLGHALGCAGLALVIGEPRKLASTALGALLLALAVFVKPTFIVQPLALVLWFAIYEPIAAAVLIGWGLLFGLAGLAATDIGLHTDLVRHLLLARTYSFSRAISHPGQWLVTGLIPLAATLSLLRARRDRAAVFCAIYAIVAFILCLVVASGEGVGGNATFDLSIAVALGTAVFIDRIRRAAPDTPGLAHLVALASVVSLIAILAVSAFGGWSSGPSIPQRFALRATTARDIAFLKAQPGPSLCEMPSLCYWAAKPVSVDVWGTSEALHTRTRNVFALEALLNAHIFRGAELDRRTRLSSPSSLAARFAHNYRADHVDALGVFYVAR